MQQVYWIKSSQTWKCPKAGAWKVVCVGGGASGGITFHENVSALQSAGGTTSFGSLLSAPGGAIETTCPILINSCGGYGGYDGMNYGGTPLFAYSSTNVVVGSTLNGGFLGSTGLGYGAGGGVGRVNALSYQYNTQAKSTAAYAVPGKCGGMTIGIFDLTLNQSISCTVGSSTKPTINASTLIQQYKKGNANITEVVESSITAISKAVTAGTSGVIYIEFLG